ncbi:uncharacterized protein BDZ99DRAFT_166637 [Mytilinidion resinicola]|uniref:Uncharacterized protein n=1 Tax=Mytilinidion resinicola TaxID=574789 RepID=A0A6A6Y3X9_9PEZI|nr:uncharacterized protein BDZ99DRAFT_166637 [Mytilinidion resinicola]KAF2803541.1 hypothetical protein BDZ99DRAFT_166637 [Mytilinidion resinicola]
MGLQSSERVCRARTRGSRQDRNQAGEKSASIDRTERLDQKKTPRRWKDLMAQPHPTMTMKTRATKTLNKMRLQNTTPKASKSMKGSMRFILNPREIKLSHEARLKPLREAYAADRATSLEFARMFRAACPRSSATRCMKNSFRQRPKLLTFRPRQPEKIWRRSWANLVIFSPHTSVRTLPQRP